MKIKNHIIRLLLTTTAILLISASAWGAAGISWGGNLEIDNTYQASPSPGTQETVLDGSLNLKAEINGGEKQSGVILLKYAYQTQDQTQDMGSLSLYQGYLDLLLSYNSLLRLGRQKISWGSGFAWNPTNYIGADKNRADLAALNPGVDAIDYEVTWGNSLGVVALKPQSTWETWGRAVKFGWQAGHGDLALSVYQTDDNNAFGIDYAISVGNYTIYTEISSKTGRQFYITEDGGSLSEKSRPDSKRYLHGVIGVNGNLADNVTVLLEYYYNQEGWDDQETANYLQYYATADTTKKISLIAEKAALFAEVRKNYLDFVIRKGEVAEDLALSINLLFGLDDQSYLLIPKLEYQIGQNTLFELYVDYFGGNDQSEFGLIGNEVVAKFTVSF